MGGKKIILCAGCYATQREFDANFLPHVEYARPESIDTTIRRPARLAATHRMAASRPPIQAAHDTAEFKSADGRTMTGPDKSAGGEVIEMCDTDTSKGSAVIPVNPRE